MSVHAGFEALATPFPAGDRGEAPASVFKLDGGVADGLLGDFDIEQRRALSGCHGAWLHDSNADEVQVVEPLERRRCMDARAFDRDDTCLLEARDRRIDLSGRTTQGPVHSLALTATASPHNFEDHQILCALHRNESVSYRVHAGPSIGPDLLAK